MYSVYVSYPCPYPYECFHELCRVGLVHSVSYEMNSMTAIYASIHFGALCTLVLDTLCADRAYPNSCSKTTSKNSSTQQTYWHVDGGHRTTTWSGLYHVIRPLQAENGGQRSSSWCTHSQSWRHRWPISSAWLNVCRRIAPLTSLGTIMHENPISAFHSIL